MPYMALFFITPPVKCVGILPIHSSPYDIEGGENPAPTGNLLSMLVFICLLVGDNFQWVIFLTSHFLKGALLIFMYIFLLL